MLHRCLTALLGLTLWGCPTQPSPAPPRPTLTPKIEATPAPLNTPKPTPTPELAKATPTPTPRLVLPGPETGPASKVPRGPEDPTSAASWRAYGESCLLAQDFNQASQAFAAEARIYRQKGDPQAAAAEELKAARYRTQIELYYWRPSQAPSRPLARLEPEQGCLLGAFIDRDDRLKSHLFSPQHHGDIAQFNQIVGRPHASFFTYLSLDRPFPRSWADYVRQQQAIPQLAWEPRNLEQVSPQRLEEFVDQLVDYDGPVLIRFAGEMNGNWTAYHGQPARYRQVFRQVHQALRRAPKVALMWCPNALPSHSIDDYYPGDEACDWVGVNFYSVPYLDNDPQRPGDWIHPVDLLEQVYRRYSGRKPIAIGEYAASHQASSDPTPRLDFARIKLAQLYQSLPLAYPQVKLISWYDCNNILKARSERQLNNFQLTDVPEIVEDYRRWTQQPWFLGAGQNQAPYQAWPFPKALPGSVKIQTWVRSHQPNPQVFLRLDGRLVQVSQLPHDQAFQLPNLKSGPHRLEVLVYSPGGTFVAKKVYPFEI